MIEVFVIIINYNSGVIIQKAIKTLKEDHLNIKILVLDNNSTDNSLCLLEQIIDSRVELLKSSANKGFSGGCNMAYEYIKNTYGLPEYIFLFNPDALAIDNLIFKLKQTLDSVEKAAIISPRITLLNSEDWYSGAIIDYKKLKIINVPSHFDNFKVRKTDVFNGCASLIKGSAIEKTGEFNEDLFMYYDEADYSSRINKANYEIYYDPTCTIKHDVSYTTRNISHIKTYYMTRNNYIYFMANKPYSKTITFLILTKNIIRNIVSLMLMGKLKNTGYALLGIYHFLIKRYGKL